MRNLFNVWDAVRLIIFSVILAYILSGCGKVPTPEESESEAKCSNLTGYQCVCTDTVCTVSTAPVQKAPPKPSCGGQWQQPCPHNNPSPYGFMPTPSGQQ